MLLGASGTVIAIDSCLTKQLALRRMKSALMVQLESINAPFSVENRMMFSQGTTPKWIIRAPRSKYALCFSIASQNQTGLHGLGHPIQNPDEGMHLLNSRFAFLIHPKAILFIPKNFGCPTRNTNCNWVFCIGFSGPGGPTG